MSTENETLDLIEKAAGNIERVATEQKASAEKIVALETKAAELGANLHAAQQLIDKLQFGGGHAGETRPAPLVDTLREKFIGSDALTQFRTRGVSTGSIDLGLTIKALTSQQGPPASSDSSTWNVQAERVPGLFGYGYRAFGLMQALPIRPITTNALEAHQLSGFVAAAAAQEYEGAQKAEQETNPVLETFPVATVAVFQKVSKQLLNDDASVQTSLVGLLGHSVTAKAERLLVYGTGADGQPRGIWGDATTFVPAIESDTAEDAIGDGLAAMQANGYMVDVIVMNPVSWRAIQRRKSSADGQYLMGSPAAPVPPSLWGVPVVVTAAMDIGDVLLIDSRYCPLLDREAVTAFVGFEDSDNLRKNLATILVEGRWGVALLDTWAAYKLQVEEPAPSS